MFVLSQHRLSFRIYENLPEVQRRREEERRKAEYRSYRLNAELYNKVRHKQLFSFVYKKNLIISLLSQIYFQSWFYIKVAGEVNLSELREVAPKWVKDKLCVIVCVNKLYKLFSVFQRITSRVLGRRTAWQWSNIFLPF